MILASNGTRTYVFENLTHSLSDFSKDYAGPGYCFEIATYPGQDNSSVTAISNVAASAFKEKGKAGTCFINFNSKAYIWAVVVDHDSELYKKIISHYIDDSRPDKAPEIDTKKIAAIKALLSDLNEQEVALLTGK